MDYGKIIETGFSQAWKHKTLWIFGLFVSGGSGLFLRFRSDFWPGRGDFSHVLKRGLWPDISFLDINPLIIFFLAVVVLFLVCILFCLAVISIGALIDAARCLKENREYRFGSSLKAGLKKFWSLLGITILTLIIGGAAVIILVLMGVAAFVIHIVLGFLSLVFLIPLLMAAIFVMTITAALAERIIVIENKPVFDSIEESFALWKKRFGSSLLYALIYLGISIAVGLCALVIFIMILTPFIAIGFFNIWAAIFLGVPVIILVLLVVNGFTGGAMHLMTTEFYYQLRGLELAKVGLVYTAPVPPSIYPEPTKDTPPAEDIPPPSSPYGG